MTVTASVSSPTVTATLSDMTPVAGQTVVVGSTAPGQFRDRAGALVDPTGVALTVVDPAGAVQTFTGAALTHPSVGVYEAEVTVDQEGFWRFRLEGTVPGDGSAVSEGWVCVTDTAVGVGS